MLESLFGNAVRLLGKIFTRSNSTRAYVDREVISQKTKKQIKGPSGEMNERKSEKVACQRDFLAGDVCSADI